MTAVPLLLGVGWGALVAIPVLWWRPRRSRARTLVQHSADVSPPRHVEVWRRLSGAPILRVVPAVAGRRRARRRARSATRELPVVTDLLRVAIGAGANPSHAVAMAASWAPPASSRRLRRVGELTDQGLTFVDALATATRDSPGWVPIVDALGATERLGTPIGPALARVADAQRADLRRLAEAHARRVPVRLLFPLVFLVLPAFGLLTVVPVLVNGLTSL